MKKYLFIANIFLFVLLIFSFHRKYSTNNTQIIKEQTVEQKGYLNIQNDKLEGKFVIRDNSFSNLFVKNNNKKDPLISKDVYLQTKWSSSDINVPNDINWENNLNSLSKEKPLILRWKNKEGSIFIQSFQIIDEHMLKVEYSVFNANDKKVNISLNMNGASKGANAVYNSGKNVIHTTKSFDHQKSSWCGVDSNYFGLFVIPEKSINFSKSSTNYNMDLGKKSLNSKESASWNFYVFMGPKSLNLLEKYAQKYNIDNFGDAIHYGRLYYITKPLFKILSLLNGIFGNFIISLFCLTLLVKVFMMPFAYKSHVSMIKMQNLQPQIDRIKEMHGSNNMAAHQAILSLYKKESINPLSGGLSLIFQLPILIPLYNIISMNVSAKYSNFLWLSDLSMPDSYSLSNLFGLLSFNILPFNITILSMIFVLTILVQQWKMMKMQKDKFVFALPFVMMVLLSSTSSAFMLYMIWSNVLSWIQSLVFNRIIRK